jgi:hypothetical protein
LTQSIAFPYGTLAEATVRTNERNWRGLGNVYDFYLKDRGKLAGTLIYIIVLKIVISCYPTFILISR